jgi:hypothetical protein
MSVRDSEVAVSTVSEVAHLYTQADWTRVLDAYVSFIRQVEWITEEVRTRNGIIQ